MITKTQLDVYLPAIKSAGDSMTANLSRFDADYKAIADFKTAGFDQVDYEFFKNQFDALRQTMKQYRDQPSAAANAAQQAALLAKQNAAATAAPAPAPGK